MAKNYYPVSEIDEKLKDYKKQHPRTPQQQAEYEKYQRIIQKRDQVQ